MSLMKITTIIIYVLILCGQSNQCSKLKSFSPGVPQDWAAIYGTRNHCVIPYRSNARTLKVLFYQPLLKYVKKEKRAKLVAIAEPCNGKYQPQVQKMKKKIRMLLSKNQKDFFQSPWAHTSFKVLGLRRKKFIETFSCTIRKTQ